MNYTANDGGVLIATDDKIREELIEEIDRRARRIRDLYEQEVEANRRGEHHLAERLKDARIAEEPGWGAVYRKYCSFRPSVVDIPTSELWGRRIR